jgi:CHAT domain-containing protein
LKIAGVDKIIMSLSKIPDDKTPIFFECFYSELFKGLTIHTAFSNTQKEMRKRYGFEDDFWTSFILLE